MGSSVNIKAGGRSKLLGKRLAADFNDTGDSQIDLIPGNKRITEIIAVNGSGLSANAAGGIYSDVLKGGVEIVPAAQSWAGLDKNAEVVAALDNTYYEGSEIYFSLTTAEGAALTGDIYVFGEILD